MTETILILQPIAAELRDIILTELPPGFVASFTETTDPAHLKEKLADADHVVFWDIGLPAELLHAGRRLKLAHKWGVGVENIDLDAARARSIQVARTPGSNAVPVAEFAVGLMIAIGRRIVTAHNSMIAGNWAKNEIWRRSIMLSGKTVGIVGLGAIGKEVARRVQGFGCTVLYHTRTRLSDAEEAARGVSHRGLEDLLVQSDFICLCCPLTPQTRGMIAAPQLAMMKPGSILVNVARGGIVPEADLIVALRDGPLAGAAIDVFEPEPPDPANPLLHMDNVIVTPHCASTAFENSAVGVRHWLANIVRVARGEALPETDRVI
ncbi:2-hydroxyacid dehydrogenase [Rhodopila sp.]|uniref:2-hydroxyacid dehydrogenase n=1 Tax=Rhodopila sp. TaxID=2480087 RepID=UPI003D12AB9A